MLIYIATAILSFAAGYIVRHYRRRWPTDTRQLMALAHIEEGRGHYLAHLEQQQCDTSTIHGMYDALTSAELELRG